MCKHLSGLNSAVAATLVLFLASRLIVAYSINYLLPVKFPPVGERNFVRLYTWLGYWVTLVMFFLDTCHSALAVTLDVAEKVTPLGNKQPGSHEFGVVAHLVLLGTKATFEARMFLFYWNKLFHGNKDLFSAALILRSIPIERSEARIQILWSNSLGSMLLKGWGGDIAGAMGAPIWGKSLWGGGTRAGRP